MHNLQLRTKKWVMETHEIGTNAQILQKVFMFAFQTNISVNWKAIFTIKSRNIKSKWNRDLSEEKRRSVRTTAKGETIAREENLALIANHHSVETDIICSCILSKL